MNKNVNQSKRSSASRRRSAGVCSVALATIIAVLSVSVGLTLALVFTNTDSLINRFLGSKVACQVTETINGTEKTNVAVKNTGDTESYIRVALVITWMSEDTTTVSAQKPVENTDYTIQFAQDSGWVLASDGYWYYTAPVAPEHSTNVLISSCVPKSTAPDGFYLSVEIVASAIQSTPATTVAEQWNTGVSGVQGTTLQIKTQ